MERCENIVENINYKIEKLFILFLVLNDRFGSK